MINKHLTIWDWVAILLIVCGCFFICYNGSIFYKSHLQSAKHLTSPTKIVEQKPLSKQTSYQEGEKIGTLYLPTVKKSIPIFEGTSNAILKKGAGHFSSSFFPGEKNNSILSGHRDTYFRVLKDLQTKDLLYIQTETGKFYYKVRKMEIVSADDQRVFTPKSRGILTLTTCYPFYYIGDAPKRYIITADLLNN
ncbi:class D sortase [Niallia nealsonii]|uniref:Class D sortase n=1 Tax=Niallia nealsonii TaxID=115979 RepID=A0A2N0YYQ5_9BACI|nr:class D sortase [Niallia nealsonii]PKG22388.1 class D sortase [Niallia nealsonii]